MQCPACKTENEAVSITCINCQTVLPTSTPPRPAKRKSRGRLAENQPDLPISPLAVQCNRDAVLAYRLCLIGVVPFLGLLLGPLSAIMASRILRKVKDDPGFTAQARAYAALFLGSASAVFNWIGLTLMLLGWYLS